MTVGVHKLNYSIFSSDLLPICSDFQNNISITTSLPDIAVLKTAVNHHIQNPPKSSSYMIVRLHFFLVGHRQKETAQNYKK